MILFVYLYCSIVNIELFTSLMVHVLNSCSYRCSDTEQTSYINNYTIHYYYYYYMRGYNL